MKIKMYMKNINRYDMPDNRSKHRHILNINRIFVSELLTDHVPEIGEIIFIKDKNEYYIVSKKIRVVSNKHTKEFILEVSPYSTKTFMQSGSDQWWEDIPLVTDLQDKQ